MSSDHTPIHASPYEWLKKMTVDCCFRPGEQLIIGQLAGRLRVSQTPIREALIRLQSEALLDTMPRRGFFARTLGSKEMISVLQFKFAILKFSVEQAIHPLDRAATVVCSPTSAPGHGIALGLAQQTKNLSISRLNALVMSNRCGVALLRSRETTLLRAQSAMQTTARTMCA